MILKFCIYVFVLKLLHKTWVLVYHLNVIDAKQAVDLVIFLFLFGWQKKVTKCSLNVGTRLRLGNQKKKKSAEGISDLTQQEKGILYNAIFVHNS